MVKLFPLKDAAEKTSQPRLVLLINSLLVHTRQLHQRSGIGASWRGIYDAVLCPLLIGEIAQQG